MEMFRMKAHLGPSARLLSFCCTPLYLTVVVSIVMERERQLARLSFDGTPLYLQSVYQ